MNLEPLEKCPQCGRNLSFTVNVIKHIKQKLELQKEQTVLWKRQYVKEISKSWWQRLWGN